MPTSELSSMRRHVHNTITKRRALRVMISSVLCILAAVYLHTYVQLIHAYVLFRDWNANNISFRLATSVLATYDAGVIMVNSARVLLDGDQAATNSKLPAVHLRVEPSSLEKMVADLPASVKDKYYPSQILYPDGTWQRAQYRLRGRSSWHWQLAKPSLRIKLRKSMPIDLQRHINLINPEDRGMISNILGEKLAEDMGVLTHETKFVRLFLNGQYRGVYHQTTREDENWLRLKRRMPGPLFIGDRLKFKWREDQFDIAGDQDVLSRINPLATLLQTLDMPAGPDRQEALWRILSRDGYARWMAAISIAGSSHTDFHHNHLYYFDPTTGLLEPAISDINGHGLHSYPKMLRRLVDPWRPLATTGLNQPWHPLMDTALRDPRLRHLRNLHLYQAINGVASSERQRGLLAEFAALIDDDVKADHNKGAIERTFIDWYRIPYDNRQYEESKVHIYDWIGERNDFLTAELENTEVRLEFFPETGAGRLRFEVEVEGNAAVELDVERLGVSLFSDRDLDGRAEHLAIGEIILHPGLVRVPLLNGSHKNASNGSQIYNLKPGGERYLFAVENPLPDFADRLADAFTNAVTGSSIEAEAKAPGEIVEPEGDYVSIHPWRFAEPLKGDVRLGPGEVVLHEDLLIAPGQRLMIAAGTGLRLVDGVSILSQGQVQISGTPQAPVTISRLDVEKAWGALVIQGPASKGSSISNAEIAGGSMVDALNIRYSGMVSVHWSPDFALTDTKISGNILSDDTLHIVSGNFELRNVAFSKCYADCVDFDYAEGEADTIRIDGPGNDGFDFMTSKVELSKIEIVGAGDKAFSVGEGSEVLVQNVRVKESNTGFAVKDKSSLSLREGLLANNRVAVDIFAKNWRFGGAGRAQIEATEFKDNQVNFRLVDSGEALLIDLPELDRVTGDGVIEYRSSAGESS